ncbi:hypothetical protein CLOACE_02240 [Clostridium acetireducens DSM 10703]|uniref:DUF2953 domain-containing protein n=1 Tax=Clostridium acetireducens DSM 10703 TaxID=1121290 RepID=A0A1E8F1Z0_9CLOT|nr:DUF2953 domain-containing protein [Clostridium acetireducens]OFI07620.1 hypothetical protein CLOACE_02240 [Clostridium acetireducens DSM 10703]
MYLFIVVLFFILFIPFPIKICFYYNNGKINVFLYKINLSNNINKKYNIKKEGKKEYDNKEKVSYVYLKNTYGSIYKIFQSLKFKPKLSFHISLYYGLGDAAHTAIFYGILNSLYTVIYKTIDNFFNIKHIAFKVKPNLENKVLKVNITSIFYINLAKLIYMLIIFFIKSHKNKSVNYSKSHN